jgi:hypothetical protein
MSNMVYLMCSLPSLTFGQFPPITFDEFLQEAKKQLSERNFNKLEIVDMQKVSMDVVKGKLKAFISIFGDVKEDLSEIRKAKVEKRNPNLAKLPNTIAGKNPLEREKLIMEWQWEVLDSIEWGKAFSLSEVLVYKLKLQILCRLQSFNIERGSQVLASVVNPSKKEEAEAWLA